MLIIDFETRSKCNLKKHGAWIYSRDKSTEPIVLGYKFLDSNKVNFWRPGENIPDGLKNYEGPILAHNYFFEYSLIVNYMIKNKYLPKHFSDIARYQCTMSLALRWGLPGGLDKLSRALNLKDKKETDLGKKLIQKYSVLNRKNEFNEINDDDLIKMLEYNRSDILATEHVYNIVPPLGDFETKVFELDKKINLRGITVDRKVIKKLIEAYEFYMNYAEKRAVELAGFSKSGKLLVKSNKEFLEFINSQLIKKIENVQKPTLLALVDSLCENPGTSTVRGKDLIEVLQMRDILAASAPKKLFSMLNFSDETGKARGQLQYFGAHTGRWAGRGLQPHNFPREKTKNFYDDFKKYTKMKLSSDPLDHKSDFLNRCKIVNSLLRGCIVPSAENKIFLVGDYSSIEPRVLFCLCSCDNGLDAYRRNIDIYVEFAKKFNSKNKNAISAVQRNIAKAAILGLGYGMGNDRFYKHLLENTSLKSLISWEKAYEIKKLYLEEYREVSKFWELIENSFMQSIVQRGESIELHYLIFKSTKTSTQITLPSGRILNYFRARINRKQIEYLNRFGHYEKIWGGKLVENIVQAVSRDIMCEHMLLLESNKMFEIIFTVHDEIILEIEKKNADKKLEMFKKIIETPPRWVRNLPLKSDCKILERYGK